MGESSDGSHVILAMFEDTDFIGDAGVAQFIYTQAKIDDRRKGDRAKEIALRMDNKANLS